jgi:pyridoxine kinase
LQFLGHEVMQIPTVLLSNHPGLGKPVGQATSAPLMEEMFQALSTVGAFNDLAAVMTGYFTSAPQVIAVAKQIADLKRLNQALQVLVDPVIGDHGKLYVGVDVAEAIRDQLLPLATITTPNLFELTWLAGTADIKTAVKTLAVAETIVTSLPEDDTHLATELHFNLRKLHHSLVRFPNVPNGTGDYLAGCYLSERLCHSAEEAFSNTMQRVERAVGKSVGASALQLN